MKILNLLTIGALVFALALSSCKKDKEEEVTPGGVPSNETTWSTEDDKKSMEAAGTEMIGELTELKNSNTIKSTNNLVSLTETADPFGGGEQSKMMKKSSAFQVLQALNIFSQNQNPDVVFTSLKSTKIDSLGNPETPQELFDDAKGTYTWNATTSSWDKTTGSNIVLAFPSTEGGTANNATYTVTYAAYTGTNAIPDYEGDLPAGITAELKIDGTAELTLSFDATYNANGEPSKVTTSLTINPFKFTVELTNTTSEIGYIYSFKNESKSLMEVGANATGNFSVDNIETVGGNENGKIEDISKIATSVEAHFQILNFKLEGDVDLDGLSKDLTAAGGSETIEDSKAIEIINNNYNITLLNADKNTKVAETEFYLAPYTYEEWVYNETTYEYEPVEMTDEEMMIRFVFNDGSNADLETYFGEGFASLEQEMTDFITELETEFGEEETF